MASVCARLTGDPKEFGGDVLGHVGLTTVLAHLGGNLVDDQGPAIPVERHRGRSRAGVTVAADDAVHRLFFLRLLKSGSKARDRAGTRSRRRSRRRRCCHEPRRGGTPTDRFRARDVTGRQVVGSRFDVVPDAEGQADVVDDEAPVPPPAGWRADRSNWHPPTDGLCGMLSAVLVEHVTWIARLIICAVFANAAWEKLMSRSATQREGVGGCLSGFTRPIPGRLTPTPPAATSGNATPR